MTPPPEALAGLLAAYGRIALLSPEGDVFDQMAGRYNQSAGPNLGVYLKGHAGDLLKVDRRGRPPEYVERPCLTIGLAVQPEVLQGLAGRPGFGGRGLLARFLYSLPQSLVGRREVGAPPVPQAMADRYAVELQALAASLSRTPGDGPTVLTRVKGIGNDFALDEGVGICGKGGQTVPAGVGQPTLLIDGLTVGGTAA